MVLGGSCSHARAASSGRRLPRLGRVTTASPAASEEPFAGVRVVIRDGRDQEGPAALDEGIEDVSMRRTPLSPSDGGGSPSPPFKRAASVWESIRHQWRSTGEAAAASSMATSTIMSS